MDALKDIVVKDAGDVEMYSGDVTKSCDALEKVVEKIAKDKKIPVILGGDHTVTWPNATGVAKAIGWGKIAVLHFDAHADTGDIAFGSLVGHGQPMRRLIESGAVKGNKFFQIGLRGYWPPEDILQWMAQQEMRSYEMSEIVQRGFDEVLNEVIKESIKDVDGIFLSVDIDVVDPGSAPGTGTPEPGGLSSRQLLDAVRKISVELPVVGMDVVEVAPAYDHAEITALLANRVVLEALSGIALRKKNLQTGQVFNYSQSLLKDR
jgi:agmatinase